MFVFFPVNLKSARERCFFENFHGHFLAFTGTFWWKFTGKGVRSRALFGSFSRALFRVHGQKNRKFSRALFEVHGHVLTYVHGHFQCSRALLVTKCNKVARKQKTMFLYFLVKIFWRRANKIQPISQYYQVALQAQTKWSKITIKAAAPQALKKFASKNCSRAVYWSSRALFRKKVHGHLQDSRALSGKKVHGHFLNSRALFGCSRALFWFTGIFVLFFSRALFFFHGQHFRFFSRVRFRFSREKKTLGGDIARDRRTRAKSG